MERAKHHAWVIHRVRRLASKGWSADDIACIYPALTPADIHAILAVVRASLGPHRPIRGILARRVRLRRGCGRTAEAIAAEFHIDPESVRAFLALPPPPRPRQPRPIDPERLVPRQPHCRRRTAGMLNRARSPNEQAALSAWERSARAAAGPELPGPERPAIDLVEVPARICPAAVEAQGDWGPMQASFASGGNQGNAALTDAEAVRIRARRAAGVPRKDLAREYGVSVATVTRITRGDTYRDAAAVAPHDLAAAEPPATSPVPEPWPGERWEEPRGDRRRRGSD